MTVSTLPITVETHFLAQVEDAARWEDRFDLLVRELNKEFGTYFLWSTGRPPADVDIAFILYPPGQHDRMVESRALENYVSENAARLINVHVIVIGRNPRNAKVQAPDVVDIVNVQCIPCGVKAQALRVLRPEDLDDEVRGTLIRLFSRQQGGALRPPDEQALALTSSVTDTSHFHLPPYESSDL